MRRAACVSSRNVYTDPRRRGGGEDVGVAGDSGSTPPGEQAKERPAGPETGVRGPKDRSRLRPEAARCAAGGMPGETGKCVGGVAGSGCDGRRVLVRTCANASGVPACEYGVTGVETLQLLSTKKLYPGESSGSCSFLGVTSCWSPTLGDMSECVRKESA
ncbi:hypothetical protein DIPPA_20242 [Diplonema papillatum]|nr:hypothetical protein DIPPA_20242 [Diplonema papillatum]